MGQALDNRYHVFWGVTSSTTSDDPQTLDYSVTTKYDNQGYVAVSATFDDPSSVDQWCIKLLEFDNAGAFQVGSYFYPAPPYSHNIHPLKIITLSGNQGYLITGYHEHISTSCPMPFVVQLDVSYNVLAQHVFQTCGFFTDVDEIPGGGGYIFSGSWSSSMNFNADRNGAIMKTDVNFNPTYSRSIFNFSPTTTVADFDIVHDLIIVDSSRAYITGGFTDTCVNTSSGASWQPPGVSGHMLFGEIDLATGNFNWTNNIVNNIPTPGGNAYNQTIGSRVIFNDNYIAVATNNGVPGTSCIIFFNRNTGMFVAGYYIENTSININSGRLTTHIPFIQNMYFIDVDKIFYSGKEIAIIFNSNPTHYEIPSSGELDINGNIGNGRLYVTDQHYAGNSSDVTSYYFKYGDCVLEYFPFYAASNTIPQNGNTGEFVTITHDNYDNLENKTWIFTNDNQVCINYYLELIAVPIIPKPQISVHNIPNGNPDLLNLLLLKVPLNEQDFVCDENPE